jgi:CotS family spore coat protein
MDDSSSGFQGFSEQRMRYERLTEAVKAYGPTPYSVFPVGSGFKVETSRGPRYLKRFRYGPRELMFVYYCLEYLRGRGFDQASRIYLTMAGHPYVELDGEVFYLRDWFECVEPDFADPGTLKACARLLAEMHAAGEGFAPPPDLSEVRLEYGSWLDKCILRLREIYGYAELAEEDSQGLKFDRRYAKSATLFLRQAEDAVRRMAELPLTETAKRERELGVICHRNFTPRQIVLDERARLKPLDFDNCTREIRLDDVAKFVRKAAYLDLDKARFILQCYGDARGRELDAGELGLIAAYLLFPREFWVIGRSRFEKDHRRERTLRRLIENVDNWGRFADGIGGLRTAVTAPVSALLAEDREETTGERPSLPEQFTFPDGPHQPLIPFPEDSAPAVRPLRLWRVDEVRIKPEHEEVSEVEKIAWQTPEPREQPVPEPEIGTVPARFPDGVEVGKAAAAAAGQPTAGVQLEPAPAEAVEEPIPVYAPAGEPAPAAGEPAPAAGEAAPAVAEATPAVLQVGPGIAEQPAAEALGAVAPGMELTGQEYRASRAAIATSRATVVWGRWPKPVAPKSEDRA